MLHLRAAEILPGDDDATPRFPFTVPVVAALAHQPLIFDNPVTFLVGENGTGKSTVLEAIACTARMITVGSAQADEDPTLVAGQALATRMRLTWSPGHSRRGFFLRAEDFFGYATGIDRLRQDLERDRAQIMGDTSITDRARGLGMLAYNREIDALWRDFGDGADTRSHGESFLHLFANRVHSGGIYLLDEPETPLSPLRQLTLLSLIRGAVVAGDTQFIIATHSPMLMAYPDAAIYLAGDDGFVRAQYEDIEHVRITRDFLANPDAFLRHL